MKTDYFTLIEIINKELDEVMDFTNIDGFDYQYFNSNDESTISLIGEFKLDDGSNVQVHIQKINPELVKTPPVLDKTNGVFNIVYTVEGKTTIKELIKILKTITLIVKIYIDSKNNSNPIYILYSEPKDNVGLTDGQKNELYKELLKKQLTPEYRISSTIYNKSKELIAFQKDKIWTKRYNNKMKIYRKLIKDLEKTILIKECRKVINNEIALQYRKEAREIIALTTTKIRKEFIKYHNENKGNICCMVLDKAKQQLIAEGKMKINNNAFGKLSKNN
jgi:hypothetical protein